MAFEVYAHNLTGSEKYTITRPNGDINVVTVKAGKGSIKLERRLEPILVVPIEARYEVALNALSAIKAPLPVFERAWQAANLLRKSID